MAQKQVFAEDQYGHKIDRCVSDAMIKFGKPVIPQLLCQYFNFHALKFHNLFFADFQGVGLTIGGLVSLLFVKRRLWPVVGGGFFGLGGKLKLFIFHNSFSDISIDFFLLSF